MTRAVYRRVYGGGPTWATLKAVDKPGVRIDPSESSDPKTDLGKNPKFWLCSRRNETGELFLTPVNTHKQIFLDAARKKKTLTVLKPHADFTEESCP